MFVNKKKRRHEIYVYEKTQKIKFFEIKYLHPHEQYSIKYMFSLYENKECSKVRSLEYSLLRISPSGEIWFSFLLTDCRFFVSRNLFLHL